MNKNFANSLELLTPEGKYNYIAYLLADENGVSVKVAKYAGMNKVDLIETVPLREALINAVVHNDFSHEIPPVFEIFSDRMEFTSYGGLIQGQSKEDFFSCSSMPRNRELMRVFKDVGLVEQLGSGMSRILQFYDRNIFEISDHFIKVTFPFSLLYEKQSIVNGDENGDENKILNLIKGRSDITAKQMSQQTGFSTRKISRIIKGLRETGKIIRVGSDRKGHWKIGK